MISNWILLKQKEPEHTQRCIVCIYDDRENEIFSSIARYVKSKDENYFQEEGDRYPDDFEVICWIPWPDEPFLNIKRKKI